MTDSKIGELAPITAGRTADEKAANLVGIFLIQCMGKADKGLDGLSEKNELIGQYNDLLAKLGKLDAMIAGSKNNDELKKALDKEPTLLNEINAAINGIGLNLFDRSIGPDQGPEKSIDSLMTRCVIDSAKRILRGQWDSDPSTVKSLFATLQEPAPTNSKFDDIPDDAWIKLALKIWPRGTSDHVLTTVRTDLNPIFQRGEKLEVEGWSYQPVPPMNAVLAFHFVNLIREEAVQRYKNEMWWRNYPLNRGHDGGDVFEALQKVKTLISIESNELQKMTMLANADMQLVTRALDALSEILNKMFSGLDKILAAM